MSICNSIRIIGGKWKGRKVFVSCCVEVRPTTNFMRETLFNWLYIAIPGAVCLDCFAGSGALGLEALSRGANAVTFLEYNIICFTTLLRTIRSFNDICSSEVIHINFLFWIKRSMKTYNVVFIDPPFNKENMIFECISLLEKHNCFKKKSWIYIESSKNQEILNSVFIPGYWILYRKKMTKNVNYYLYLRNV